MEKNLFIVKPLYTHPMPCVSPTSDKTGCTLENVECSKQDPIRDLISIHKQMLEDNSYAYFELAYMRPTEWMAWICSKARELDPDRKILAKGQGSTPEEACLDALCQLEGKGNQAKEHHRTPQNHIVDTNKMVAPYGWRLVKLADIDTAIQRASVFDDGGDGADPESARSCIEILRGMISSKAADSLEPKKEVMHDRHTGKELLYIPPAGESLYSIAQARKGSFSLALSVDAKEVRALLHSYLDDLKDWQLVPKEPTPEMIQASDDSDIEYSKRNFGDSIHLAQSGYDHYKAMLAAAPDFTGETNE